MSQEDPTPDEFDAMLEESPEETPTEPVTPQQYNQGSVGLDALVIRPEVAKALMSGMPINLVARRLGVSVASVRRRMMTLPMQNLMEIEGKRVMRNLSTRKLSDVPYEKLVGALSTLVHDMRLINNEPTEITGNISTTQIENITLALFGRGGRDQRSQARQFLERVATPELSSLHEVPPTGAEDADGGDTLGSDPLGVRGRS